MAAFDEEDPEWNTSKIKGFSFGDDDQTPWEELSKLQITSGSSGTSFNRTSSNSRDNLSDLSSSYDPGVISDKVKKAARSLASYIDENEAGQQTISEAVGVGQDSDLPTDPRELRSEVLRLRRQLRKVEIARFTPLHPKETVLNMFLGKRFSLEFYTSLRDKTDLLDEAIKFGDGNAITAIVLFVRRTLSHSRFLEVVASRPVAWRHLCAQLERTQQLSELNDLLVSLGRLEEAAVVNYKHTLLQSRQLAPDQRSRRVRTVLQNHFHGHPLADLLVQHVNLLERIAPIMDADAKRADIAQDPVLPALKYAENSETVADTLLYFCYHHWAEAENLLSSPAALRKMHNLTEKQFSWVALMARAKRRLWKDCEVIAIASKGWLPSLGAVVAGAGTKKRTAVLAPAPVLRVLHHAEAPSDVLQVFLELVDDVEKREALARTLKAYNVVIECLVQQKDRQALERFKAKLTPNSQEWYFAEHVLKTSNTKWKN